MKKIIITGITYYDEICHKLSENIDSINVCHKFTTDGAYIDKKMPNDDFIYYINTNILTTAYKNNAILYTKKINDYITGILLDDFYNSDVASLDIYDVNNLSNKIFTEYDILFIFIDNSSDKRNKDLKQYEYDYFIERISNNKTLYFLNENADDIVDIIVKYIYGSEEERNDVYENYKW